MSEKNVVIDWSYQGKTDIAMGTGATSMEKIIGWSPIIPLILMFLYFFKNHYVDWNIWQYLFAFIIAADLCIGMVANSLNSSKRFHHTPYRNDESFLARISKNHILFSFLHVHPIIIGLLYRNGDLKYGLFWYFFFVGNVLAVHNTPLYLKRVVSILGLFLAIILDRYYMIPVKGFEWLIPALFIKITYGHMVREEPYRKESC